MHKHSDFVHLHVHTQYSLLDGACHVDKMLKKAKDCYMPAIAITDHGNMFGAVDFYRKAMDMGVKPIIGCEIYVAPGSRLEKTTIKGKKSSANHLILLAKDEQGYKNLMRLVSIGYLEGFYYKPRIDKEVLAKYSKGLLGLSACLKGEVAQCCLYNDEKSVQNIIGEFQDIFGKDSFYLEIMDHGIEEQKRVNTKLLEIANKSNIPLVATNDVHYLEQSHAKAQEALLCIQTQTTLDDPNRMRMSTDQFYLKTAEEMKKTFQGVPDAIKNTLEICQKCNVELDFSHTYLPHYDIPDGKTKEQYFEEIVLEGIRGRYPEITDTIKKRVDHELEVIKNSGYISYFLITKDFISFARSKDIAVGPGRGSAAGSVVSYALGITDLDPLKYDLLFERFLNPERVSMPDIDIDFCYERRGEVIDYVVEKYGKDNVAQIVTFGTMGAKAVIRDVARVMGIPYQNADKIAKLIPTELNMTLEEALKQEPQLSDLVKTDSTIRELMETAKVLEGLARHASVHAAGVVISEKPLYEYIPLYKSSDGQVTTGFSMSAVEKVGLLKMDFLGLRTLTVIQQAIAIIKKTNAIDLDISKIPMDDDDTFAMLQKAESHGVFQLESSGMRDLLKKLRPELFEDIIALLALFRPGPLGSGMVDDFVNCKHGRTQVVYDHPLLEPILDTTYGVILYQEQVMRIVSSLAGFSLSQADLLRRAIGKKVPEIMEQQRTLFIEGCAKNDINEKIAKKTFDNIEYFAGYGFNKSHSAAYALISYQTAYLKAHYPAEFISALLTSERDNSDKIAMYINQSRKMGIEVLPPDVNESCGNFTVVNGNIRFGLSAVKNIGQAAVENIVRVRDAGGPFSSIQEFCERVETRQVNRKVLESLIKSGACDSFSLHRSQLFGMIDQVLSFANEISKDKAAGQMSFFESGAGDNGFTKVIELAIPDIEEWHENQLLAFEKEILGFYVSSHPLVQHAQTIRIYSKYTIAEFSHCSDQQEVGFGAIVMKRKNTVTKRKNEKMAILTVEDFSSECDILVFPRTYETCFEHIDTDSIVYIKGKIDRKDETPKILASEIFPVEQIKHLPASKVILELDEHGLGHGKIDVLKDIICRSPGPLELKMVLKVKNGSRVEIAPSTKFSIQATDETLNDLEELLGEGSIKIV